MEEVEETEVEVTTEEMSSRGTEEMNPLEQAKVAREGKRGTDTMTTMARTPRSTRVATGAEMTTLINIEKEETEETEIEMIRDTEDMMMKGTMINIEMETMIEIVRVKEMDMKTKIEKVEKLLPIDTAAAGGNHEIVTRRLRAKGCLPQASP